MIKQIKCIFQIIIYLFQRVISGSIRFRKDSINFNQEKQLIINSLIQQGFTQVSQLKQPRRIGARLTEQVSKSVFLSGVIQNLAFINSSISKAPSNILSSTLFELNYFRIPKAASTSMLQLLIAKNLSLNTSTLSQKQIDVLGSLLFQDRVDSSSVNFENVTIVRNPLSRLYSVYKNIFQGPPEDFIYENYLFGLFSKNMTFDHFIDNLVNIPSTIADYHFKPQYELIYDHQHVKEVKIFKMEEINMILNPYLISRFNIELPHLHKSYRDQEHFEHIYTLETAKKVYKYYQLDFVFFNYQEEFNNLIFNLSESPIK